MSTSLVTTSATWTGKQNLDYYIKPLYEGESPLIAMGVRVIPNVQGTLKLNYFDKAGKKLKAYAKGFTAATGLTMTQRDLTVVPMKAEFAQDAYEFKQTVFETALSKGVAWNDITGTVLEGIITEIFGAGVRTDIFRQFWLGDTTKTTGTTYFSATADTDYNAFNGIWPRLIADAATTAVSATGTHIYRKTVANGAVAKVDTITWTSVASAGGDMVVTVNGTDYEQVYASSLAATATAFLATNGATILSKHKITVANPSSAVLTFTSAIPGIATTIAIPSASAVLASGGVVATTANTGLTALADDESLDYLEDLWKNSYNELKRVAINRKGFLVSQSIYDNYYEALEDGGINTDMAKNIMINGLPVLRYRGIPVIAVDWDSSLAADFPAAYYPHRIIYTELDNLVLGIDAVSEFNQSEFWYNKDEQENRFRMQLKMGTNYVFNKMTSVAY